jgi:hypothetical protein
MPRPRRRRTSLDQSQTVRDGGGHQQVGCTDAQVRFEIAGADMAPGSEQLPGTTLDWQTAQHWVEFSGEDARVVWSPVEAPLVQFGDINTGKWLKKLEIMNPWFFSYAMNNYWMTNFKASQGGPATFRYSLTSRAGGPDAVRSTRFGWEVHTPLLASWIPEDSKGTLDEGSGSFFRLTGPTSSSRP